MKKRYYIFLFLMWVNWGYSQDIHWSQYDHNPVFQNPSNVGRFDGDYRFIANYRTQWKSVSVPYQTISISGEAKQIVKGFNIGAFFFHDVAGDGKLRTIELQPSVSYTFQLTADSTHLFHPGIQLGINHRSLDPTAYSYDNQWNGKMYNPSLPTKESFSTRSRTNFTLGLGAAYEFQKGKRHRFIVGAGWFNINRPNQSFFGEEVRRPMRFNVYAQAEYQVGLDWDILPSFQLNLQRKFKEFMIGSQVRYILKDRLGIYRALLGGIYMRTGDAFMLMLGMEYQNWWAGISYDINYSDLVPASRARGGLEISIRYIWNQFKPKKIIHRACPDYI